MEIEKSIRIYVIWCVRHKDTWYFSEFGNASNSIVWVESMEEAQVFRTRKDAEDFCVDFLSDREVRTTRIQ